MRNSEKMLRLFYVKTQNTMSQKRKMAVTSRFSPSPLFQDEMRKLEQPKKGWIGGWLSWSGGASSQSPNGGGGASGKSDDLNEVSAAGLAALRRWWR